MALRTTNSFEKPDSELLRRFACRLAGDGSSPITVMTGLVAGLRRSLRQKGLDLRLEPYLRARGVLRVEYIPNLHCDGALIPLGKTFADGFRMLLRKDCASTRARFTTAHELCHTFFYESVPELKFQDHEEDAGEER